MSWIGPAAKNGARLAIKYGPQAKIAWDKAGRPAADAAAKKAQSQLQRRKAFAKAALVVDGAVLKQMHEGEPVYVVLSAGRSGRGVPVRRHRAHRAGEERRSQGHRHLQGVRGQAAQGPDRPRAARRLRHVRAHAPLLTHGGHRVGSSPTWTSSLPKFLPVSRPKKASGAFSSPSTTSSW